MKTGNIMEFLDYVFGKCINEFGSIATVSYAHTTKNTHYNKLIGGKGDTSIVIRSVGTRGRTGYSIGNGDYRVGREVNIEINSQNYDEGNYIEKRLHKVLNMSSQRFRECHHTYTEIPPTDITKISRVSAYLNELQVVSTTDLEVGQYRAYTIGETTYNGYIIADISTTSINKFLIYTAKVDFTFPRLMDGIDLSSNMKVQTYRVQIPCITEIYYFESDE